jgi:hypothetical protein
LFSPCKRPKLFVEAKASSGSSPFAIRPSSLDAGASTSVVRAETKRLGSGASTSVAKLGFLGRVYQCRNVAYPQSMVVWRVKQRQTKLDAGASRSCHMISVSEVESCGGGGEPKAMMFALR